MDLNFSELMWISSTSIPDSEYRFDLGLSTECTLYRVLGFLSSRPNWVPPPPYTQESVAPPLYGPNGGDTLACGGVSGGTQFRRRDRHYGTLVILYNPSTGLSNCQENPKISKPIIISRLCCLGFVTRGGLTA
jgi:hypothetical protein